MNSYYNPRNMTQEENSHNTAKYKCKVCFSSAGFTRSHVRVPGNRKIKMKKEFFFIKVISTSFNLSNNTKKSVPFNFVKLTFYFFGLDASFDDESYN